MDKKNITPEQNEPINRVTSGQLPAELAELSEEILQDWTTPALGASQSSCKVPQPSCEYVYCLNDPCRVKCSMEE